MEMKIVKDKIDKIYDVWNWVELSLIIGLKDYRVDGFVLIKK